MRFSRFAPVYGAFLPALAAVCLSSSVLADVTHTVARGHTLEAISHRYHVSVKAIVDANHLKDPNHLKPGMTLTIPGVQPAPGEKGNEKGKVTKTAGKTPSDPVKAYAMRAKTPGVIHAVRLLANESYTIRVSDRRGRQTPTALKTFEKMLRSAGGQTHPIDPRLIALAGIVSNHFGSRKLEYISGFRPYTSTQYTPHSNHNLGRAMDFRIDGVPNEALRDYCRTLKNVGVGYYPNSTFVHLDVRTSPAYWIDYSKPGEPPRYNSPNVEADEGTSDVGNEMRAMPATEGETQAPPTDSSAPPAMSGESPATPIAPSAAPTPISPPATGVPPTLQTGAPPTQIAPPSPTPAGHE